MDQNPTFRVSSGLLEPHHFRNIGEAVWVYLWALNRQTRPDGQVLGGAPVSCQGIGDELGCSERTIRRHVRRLEDRGYIDTTRTPAGFRIVVRLQKKFPPHYRPPSPARYGRSLPKGSATDGRSDRPPMAAGSAADGRSNKDPEETLKKTPETPAAIRRAVAGATDGDIAGAIRRRDTGGLLSLWDVRLLDAYPDGRRT